MIKIWTAIMKSGLILLFLFVFSGQLIAQCNSWEAHPDGAEDAQEHFEHLHSFS